MALRALINPDAVKKLADRSSVSGLYRAIIKELPRVMVIYDVDIPVKEARSMIRYQFAKHGKLEDGQVIGILIAKGYMELEETLMQWKQKTHLLRILDPMELKKRDPSKMTYREKFLAGIEED